MLAIVFFWAKMPETKDRSLEEIEHELGTDLDAPTASPAEPRSDKAAAF